ncbi:phage tail protein [Paenibacillus soyae]|uniref:Tail fiber protein n=1 Tax=Paenibacillus soyae TaxID=2969249 RepID=A0A9X2SCD0_9BACL|nr:tail fiber protein [Paenibacillus soyae]MCR2806633.1 tail fiber protein [Paenibacillus soyae]
MEQYVGEIRMFAGTFAPVGWVLCDGSLLPISQYDTLFALLGTTYGGDGQNTFAVPNLTGRLPIGQGTSTASGTNYPLGSMGGVESVTLIQNQLPQHTHAANANSLAGTAVGPTGAFWAGDATQNTYSTSAVSGQMNPQSLSAVGGNQPHDNMMPYLPLNYIIATEGIFPQQD